MEFHHIIPVAEWNHNDPDHMIALCPLHHQQHGKLPRSKSYDLKTNPVNKLNGKIYGELGTDKKTTKFLVGSNTYENTPVVFSYYKAPILQYTIENNQALLDVYIPKSDMWPDVLIRRNNMIVNSAGMWDIEFRTNYLKVRKKSGEKFFEIDLRRDVAEISATFPINGQMYKFTPRSTNLGQNATITNSHFVNCGGGIAIGDDRHKLLWPNFAMKHPRAIFSTIN